MSTLNPPKTISKRHELREDKVITGYARAWEFFDQNRTLVYGILAGIVVLVLAVVGYVLLQHQKNADAERMLGSVIAVYEQGNYRQALDGTDDQTGLLAIADEYGGTEAGNLATFYAADALFRLGEYDQALELFEEFDKPDNLVGASAYAGMASIYEVKGEYERAGDLYRRAATTFESDVLSPQYLLNAGGAYEEAGDYSEAVDVYEAIQDDYPDSSIAQGIEFYLARARAEMK